MWFTADAGHRKESRADEKHTLFPVKAIGLRPKSVAVIRINERDTETNHFPFAPRPTGGQVVPCRSSLKSTLMHGYTSAMHGHECVIHAIVNQRIFPSWTTPANAHLHKRCLLSTSNENSNDSLTRRPECLHAKPNRTLSCLDPDPSHFFLPIHLSIKKSAGGNC